MLLRQQTEEQVQVGGGKQLVPYSALLQQKPAQGELRYRHVP